MKKIVNQPKLQKVRSRLNQTEVYYTYSHWDLKEIDGVKFIPVVKTVPSNEKTQQIHYMRKDNMEYVK
jgi:hypothetical protein